MNIKRVDLCDEKDCMEMIDYFLKFHAVEATIKYTERLYEILDFNTKYMEGVYMKIGSTNGS